MTHGLINPAHYAKIGIEPIRVIELWDLDYHLGNALKYIARAGRKGSRRADLIKAANYCWRAATGEWLPESLLDDGAAE